MYTSRRLKRQSKIKKAIAIDVDEYTIERALDLMEIIEDSSLNVWWKTNLRDEIPKMHTDIMSISDNEMNESEIAQWKNDVVTFQESLSTRVDEANEVILAARDQEQALKELHKLLDKFTQ